MELLASMIIPAETFESPPKRTADFVDPLITFMVLLTLQVGVFLSKFKSVPFSMVVLHGSQEYICGDCGDSTSPAEANWTRALAKPEQSIMLTIIHTKTKYDFRCFHLGLLPL